MPIRASAVRGQLRFWWRLLYTAGLPPREGFSLECSLWGGIRKSGSRASLVALRVKGRAVRATEFARKGEIRTLPRYALIPERNKDPRLLPAGYEFDVVLQFSRASSEEQQERVRDTLRWWTNFGGVGSRTRRGLGAIQAASNDCELKPVSCEEVRRQGGRLAIGSQAAGDSGMAWRRAGAWECADARPRPRVDERTSNHDARGAMHAYTAAAPQRDHLMMCNTTRRHSEPSTVSHTHLRARSNSFGTAP